MLYQLYRDVYGLEKDKKKKRAFIREHFQPIDVEELKPSDETVTALKEKLERMGYTREWESDLEHVKKCGKYFGIKIACEDGYETHWWPKDKVMNKVADIVSDDLVVRRAALVEEIESL